MFHYIIGIVHFKADEMVMPALIINIIDSTSSSVRHHWTDTSRDVYLEIHI